MDAKLADSPSTVVKSPEDPREIPILPLRPLQLKDFDDSGLSVARSSARTTEADLDAAVAAIKAKYTGGTDSVKVTLFVPAFNRTFEYDRPPRPSGNTQMTPEERLLVKLVRGLDDFSITAPIVGKSDRTWNHLGFKFVTSTQYSGRLARVDVSTDGTCQLKAREISIDSTCIRRSDGTPKIVERLDLVAKQMTTELTVREIVRELSEVSQRVRNPITVHRDGESLKIECSPSGYTVSNLWLVLNRELMAPDSVIIEGRLVCGRLDFQEFRYSCIMFNGDPKVIVLFVRDNEAGNDFSPAHVTVLSDDYIDEESDLPKVTARFLAGQIISTDLSIAEIVAELKKDPHYELSRGAEMALEVGNERLVFKAPGGKGSVYDTLLALKLAELDAFNVVVDVSQEICFYKLRQAMQGDPIPADKRRVFFKRNAESGKFEPVSHEFLRVEKTDGQPDKLRILGARERTGKKLLPQCDFSTGELLDIWSEFSAPTRCPMHVDLGGRRYTVEGEAAPGPQPFVFRLVGRALEKEQSFAVEGRSLKAGGFVPFGLPTIQFREEEGAKLCRGTYEQSQGKLRVATATLYSDLYYHENGTPKIQIHSDRTGGSIALSSELTAIELVKTIDAQYSIDPEDVWKCSFDGVYCGRIDRAPRSIGVLAGDAILQAPNVTLEGIIKSGDFTFRGFEFKHGAPLGSILKVELAYGVAQQVTGRDPKSDEVVYSWSRGSRQADVDSDFTAALLDFI